MWGNHKPNESAARGEKKTRSDIRAARKQVGKRSAAVLAGVLGLAMLVGGVAVALVYQQVSVSQNVSDYSATSQNPTNFPSTPTLAVSQAPASSTGVNFVQYSGTAGITGAGTGSSPYAAAPGTNGESSFTYVLASSGTVVAGDWIEMFTWSIPASPTGSNTFILETTWEATSISGPTTTTLFFDINWLSNGATTGSPTTVTVALDYQPGVSGGPYQISTLTCQVAGV